MNAHGSHREATISRLEDALAIKPFGLDMQVLLTSEATAGAISVLMACHMPGEGPPDHFHLSQEEIFFIVEGSYEVTVRGRTSLVDPGTVVFIPRNVVHRFKNVGTTIARMLDCSLPGGQDRYFEAVSALAADGNFTGEKVQEINKAFDAHFPIVQ